MKHSSIQFLCLFCLFTIFYSCKKDDSPSVVNDSRAENRKELGTSAEDLLSDDIYDKLVIELVYSASFRPTISAVNNLQTFLDERIKKPGGISIVETVIDAQTGSPFTIEEIRDIEDAERTRYTEGSTISVYIFFANGNSANDSGNTVTLGSAYLNTSIVVYEKTIQDIFEANAGINLSDLESTTIQHEFGHIFGLVNLQNDDIHTDHEDPAHLKHCIVEDCLMYFESSNTLRTIERLKNRSAVATLDPLCIADLQAKGGK